MAKDLKKKKGKILEKNYEWLWNLGVNKNCIITSPKFYEDKVTGEQREIDVFIEVLNTDGTTKEKIMVECRNREKVQDVTWVEQVVTKRNDLDIDKAIMVTSSSFTGPAKIKAKHYGIEIERASSQSNEFMEEQRKNCTGKANFIFMNCNSIMIFTKKGYFNDSQLKDNIPIQKYIKSQIELFSQSEYFVKELQENQLSKNYSNFFDNENNSIESTFSFVPQKNILPIINSNNFENNIGEIERISFSIKVSPKFISFPLSRVITIFDDEVLDKTKTNKRHKSSYENNKIKITFQIHEDRMYNNITLKNPNVYWRFIGIDITLYALLGNVDSDKVEFEIKNNPKDIFGSISFNNVFN